MLKSIFRILMLLAFLLYVMIYFLCETTPGLKAALALLRTVTPGEINLRNVRGNLSDFTIEKISYNHENDHIQAGGVRIRGNPADFFRLRLRLTGISADYLDLRLHSAPAEPAASFDLRALQNVSIRQLGIKQINVSLDASPVYQFNQVALHQSGKNAYTLDAALLHGSMQGTIRIFDAPHAGVRSILSFKSIDPGEILDAAPGTLNFTLQTEFSEDRANKIMHLQINNLSGRLRQYPVQGQASFRYENQSLTIFPSQFRIAGASAAFSGSLSENWNLQWRINVPDLNILLPETHGSLATSGTLNGPRRHPDVTAQLQANRVRLFDTRIDNMRVSINMPQHDRYQFDLHAVNIRTADCRLPELNVKALSRVSKDSLLSDISAAASSANQLSGQLSLASFNSSKWLDTKLNGVLTFHAADLTALEQLNPEVRRIKGNLTGKITLSGTLAAPVVTGEGVLNHGEAALPKLGITLKQITLTGRYDNRILTAHASFTSGKGTGNMQSTLVLRPALTLNAQIRGDHLQLIQTKDYRITVTPQLNLSYDKKNLSLDGVVLVPDADITPADLSSTSTLSDDVVIIDGTKTAALPENLFIRLHLTLGDNARLQFENLSAKLTGGIDVSQTPGRQPTATGQFLLANGIYKSYGKPLSIQDGRIIYTGNSIYNPGLDIRATRKIQSIAMTSASQFNSHTGIQPAYTGTSLITIGMQINGTIKKPHITLFSIPAGMSQNDILSYLLFGYPQSELSGDNKLSLVSAAAALKLGNSPIGGITEKLQNLTGLTELNVGSTEVFNPDTNTSENATTLSLGKQLTDKLSLRYSVGVYSPVSILNLRYQLFKNMAIQSESSSLENGVDLLFGFERD
ncbi:Translocation and assembly module TamB [Aquicella siphonis]|uniref:Translocation and assembly module TamB n=1 Tax=Aquicella siphonis TaxID=254247 RepID=A0A5E4PHE8_9COXI|nr:translocation/assembly module TamB domain-containing protein [Aquicella siphonis]VVC76429.1 Translocation and assembly module TamB [Aquicella siphonis]